MESKNALGFHSNCIVLLFLGLTAIGSAGRLVGWWKTEEQYQKDLMVIWRFGNCEKKIVKQKKYIVVLLSNGMLLVGMLC